MAANQNVTQLTAQTTTDTTSLFYAVGASGTTDTGLPLSVLFTGPTFTGTTTINTVTILGGTINAATIGATTAGTGRFTNLTTTGTLTVGSTATGSTPTAGDNSSKFATTAFVVTSFAPLASPTFTGSVTIPSGASIAGYATLASPTFTGTVVIPTVTISAGTINSTSVGATTASTGKFTTLQATSTITPSTTSGIVGTTLADSAPAGSVGEYVTSTATAVNITTSNVPQNITSISLTAGDWDVWGNIEYDSAVTTTTTGVLSSVSTTSATLAVSPLRGIYASAGGVLSAGGQLSQLAPMQRLNLSTTTTVFLVGAALFAVSTMAATGIISARRRR